MGKNYNSSSQGTLGGNNWEHAAFSVVNCIWWASIPRLSKLPKVHLTLQATSALFERVFIQEAMVMSVAHSLGALSSDGCWLGSCSGFVKSQPCRQNWSFLAEKNGWKRLERQCGRKDEERSKQKNG